MLAGRKAKVVSVARTLEKLEELKKQEGPNIIVFQGDVTREKDCKAAIDLAVSTAGKLDGIIHNAGVTMRARAEKTDIQVYREIMEKGVHVMVISPGFVQTDGSLNALTADGSPYGKMDAALAGGLAPGHTAEIILDGIEHRKRDVFPAGFKEKFGLFLSKWAPSILDRMLIKSQVK